MNATHYVTAPDNSMSQSRIRKGDRIMLDTGAEIKDGDLVLAVFTDGWKICRAHFAGDKSKPRLSTSQCARLIESSPLRIPARAMDIIAIKAAPSHREAFAV